MYFWVFAKVVLLKVSILSISISLQNFMAPRWLVQFLHFVYTTVHELYPSNKM
jgi:hypothetical protein